MVNTNNNEIVTDGMRNDLWTIRDNITTFLSKHGAAVNMGVHFKIMDTDIKEASMCVDDAIYAINIAIAKKETGLEA